MIKPLYLLLILVSSITIHAQNSSLEQFKSELKSFSADSIFTMIDERLNELDSINAPDETLIELLEFKVDMSDSLGNRVMKYYAYQSMLNYATLFSSNDYYDLLKKQGNQQYKIGYPDEAMLTYFLAAELADSVHNDTMQADIYRTIGTKYKNQQNAELALKYLNLSLQINEKLQDSVGIQNCYMTIGNAYKLKGIGDSTYLDTALYYYNISLDISKAIADTRGQAGNYNNIGNVYRRQNKFKESLEQFFLALEINQVEENISWIAFNYNNIGNTFRSLGKLESALIYFKKSLVIKEENGAADEDLSPTLENLAITCADLGRFKEAYNYSVRAKRINRKFESTERARIAQELEAKFQNEKKQAKIEALKSEQSLQDVVIAHQQKDLDFQAALRKKERSLIFALGFILLSLIGAVIVFWRNSRQRKKYNEELRLKNSEIKQANSEINEARLKLEHKNKETTDSINYAKRIQAAILPSKRTLASHLNEAFVMYLPKDIVAGDFYWTERIGDNVLFAVADCTGHGVPGAMVSVICHNALNATIRRLGLSDPGEILDETTKIVLRQFEKSEEQVNDGMDIALCSFNAKTREFKYSGANTPLWIVRNDEVFKHNATRQPVGNYRNMEKFESTVIPIEKGDTIYLSSDGYIDQFGGEKGKKFLNKRFKDLLIKVARKPVNEQAAILHTTIQSWKSTYDQVDDVCVLGARLDL